jgi:hypothetical protein
MRSFLLLILIVVLALGLLLPADSLAQSPKPSSGSDTVVEVIATHTTPDSEDTYVYIRVFSNGTAEFQPSTHRAAGTKERPTIKKTLTQDEFVQIKSLVDAPQLAAVGPKFETRYAIIDSWTKWTIEIQRPVKPQIIQILEFSPGLARTMKHPYPDPLVKLGCSLEKLRADISGESTLLDGECQRVLGTTIPPKS